MIFYAPNRYYQLNVCYFVTGYLIAREALYFFVNLIENIWGLMINYSSLKNMATTNKCDFYFSLIRFKKECAYAPITVDFTPMPKPHQPRVSICPKFNKDFNYFTSSFINLYDQCRHIDNSVVKIQEEKEKFLKKMQNYQSQPAEQNVKFNPRDDKYCSICCNTFKEYWVHINSYAHKSRIRAKKVNTYIHDLCLKYKSKRDKKSSPKASNKKVSKTKKILKKTDKKQEKYKKEDFIITFPKELLEKELYQMGNSTNGMLSRQQKR